MIGRHGIVVVDDHPLVRKGIAQLLAMDAQLALVGEACDHCEAVAVIAARKPSLVLLDLNLAGRSGLETLRAIRREAPDIRVLVLTVSDAEEDLMAALKGGAAGYLLKDMEPEEILRDIHRALAGETVLSPRLANTLAGILRRPHHVAAEAVPLVTDRERQIIRCVALGKSNKLVARELGIAEGTVKVHIKRLLRKLHIRSRVDIAVWAIDHGYRGEVPPARMSPTPARDAPAGTPSRGTGEGLPE